MTRMTARLRRPALSLIALLTLAACNSLPAATPAATATPGSTSAPSASPTTGPSTNPTAAPASQPIATPGITPAPTATSGVGSTTAVVKIEQVGGMLAPWETLRFYPSVVLYEDGRLITQGPQIDIYPGPALPNLQVTHLSAAGVEQVLTWAEEAGLKGPDRQLGEPSFDAGQTVFTVVTSDGAHQTSVPDLSVSDPEVGALRQFQDVTTNLRGYLGDDVVGDDVPYAFDRLRVISGAADPSTVVDPELATTLQWRLDTPIADLGSDISEPSNWKCGVVEGDDLATLRPLLDQANELTIWESDGNQYVLRLHPLLPDEDACPTF
jgi:hypothetical protein